MIVVMNGMHLITVRFTSESRTSEKVLVYYYGSGFACVQKTNDPPARSASDQTRHMIRHCESGVSSAHVVRQTGPVCRAGLAMGRLPAEPEMIW